MMIEKTELIELAAKAGRIENYKWINGRYCHYNIHDRNFYTDSYGDKIEWNPLKDDGDALRLAIELGMSINTNYNSGVIAGNATVEANYDEPEFGYQEGMGKISKVEATRYAIVKCAARCAGVIK